MVGGLFGWCSHRDQLRRPLPLILKSRGWAHVEGDFSCPNPPDLGRERNTESVSELHLYVKFVLQLTVVFYWEGQVLDSSTPLSEQTRGN